MYAYMWSCWPRWKIVSEPEHFLEEHEAPQGYLSIGGFREEQHGFSPCPMTPEGPRLHVRALRQGAVMKHLSKGQFAACPSFHHNPLFVENALAFCPTVTIPLIALHHSVYYYLHSFLFLSFGICFFSICLSCTVTACTHTCLLI